MEPYERIITLHLFDNRYVEVPVSLLPPNSLWSVLIEDIDVDSIDFPVVIPTSTGSVEVPLRLRDVVVKYLYIADGRSLSAFVDKDDTDYTYWQYGIYIRNSEGELQRRPIIGCELEGYLSLVTRRLLQPLSLKEITLLKQLCLYLGLRELEDLATAVFVLRHNCLAGDERKEAVEEAMELLPQGNDLEEWLPEGDMKIVAGSFHSFLLTSDGRVYACGYNRKGQLGLGDNNDRSTFTLVPTTTTSPIISIVAGSYHSLLLTSDGRVYACGSNGDGQLGLGDTNDRSTFTLVPTTTTAPIISIVAGSDHSLLLTSDGRVYACGDNEEGQLGLGDEEDHSTFTIVPIITTS